MEKAFGRRGGGVVWMRWLLQWGRRRGRRRGRSFTSMVVYLRRAIPTAEVMLVHVWGRRHRVEEYSISELATKYVLAFSPSDVLKQSLSVARFSTHSLLTLPLLSPFHQAPKMSNNVTAVGFILFSAIIHLGIRWWARREREPANSFSGKRCITRHGLPPLGPHHATTTSSKHLGGRHVKATIVPTTFGLIDGLSFAGVDSLIWIKYSYTDCLPYSSRNSIAEYVSHVLSEIIVSMGYGHELLVSHEIHFDSQQPDI